MTFGGGGEGSADSFRRFHAHRWQHAKADGKSIIAPSHPGPGSGISVWKSSAYSTVSACNTARASAVRREITCSSSGLLFPDRTYKRVIVPPGMEGAVLCAFMSKIRDGDAIRGRQRYTASGSAAPALGHVLVATCNASGLFRAVAASRKTRMPG